MKSKYLKPIQKATTLLRYLPDKHLEEKVQEMAQSISPGISFA